MKATIKKTIFYFLAILMVGVINSCKDDEEDNNNSSLDGTWYFAEMNVKGYNINNQAVDLKEVVMSMSNGSQLWAQLQQPMKSGGLYFSFSGNQIDVNGEKLTYTVSGDKIHTSDGEVITYQLNNNQFIWIINYNDKFNDPETQYFLDSMISQAYQMGINNPIFYITYKK